VGSKRIGVAISDELGITAQGVETVNYSDVEKAIERVETLVRQYDAEEIVVGLPLNMDGSAGPQAESVRSFIVRMSSRIDVPVQEWDERLSTMMAERTLLEADMSRAKRRKVIDKVAAVVILQGYLDRKSYLDVQPR
jgi:putative holliday junction resolvase